MADGIYKPKYRDRKGKVHTSAYWWLSSDPVTGKRVSTRTRDKGAALAFRKERDRIANDPHYAASQGATIGRWVREVMKMKAEQRAEGTRHMYGVKLGHVVRLFGEHGKMADITPPAVDAYVAQRRLEDASNSTIGKELTAIAQLCKVAKRAGAYPGDVKALRPIGFSIDYVPRVRVASWAELAALRVVATPRQYAFIMLVVCTGCRLSEALRARAEHYDAKAKLFAVHGTKTAESAATIPLLSVFRDRFEADVLPHLPVAWPEASAGIPRLCREAKIPALTPNDLRRTTATLLVAAGVSTGLVARVLRHKDSRMVERVYGRATPTEIGVAIERQINSTVFDGSAQVDPNQEANSEPGERQISEETSGSEASDSAGSDLKSLVGNHVRVRVSKGPPSKTRISGQTAESVFDESAQGFAAALAESAERGQETELLAKPLAKAKDVPYVARKRGVR